MGEQFIICENLVKIYQVAELEMVALQGLNLLVDRGELMGIIGALYGPVVMILLITSIEVYTKYMLRSDLEVLLDRGELDLEELGLAIEEDEDRSEGPVMSALKNLAKRVRQGASEEKPEGESVPDSE